MKVFIFCASLLITVGSNAQVSFPDSVDRRKLEYYFQLHSGAMIGNSSFSKGKYISYTAGFSNGIKIGKRLRTGVGFGIDTYEKFNLLPVYLTASWDLLGKKNTLFVDASYGDAVAGWKTQSFDEYGFKDSVYGKMYCYSIGYRIKYDQLRISVGVGRKTQVVRQYYEYPTIYWISNTEFAPGEPSTKEIKSQLNRLAVYLSIGWK